MNVFAIPCLKSGRLMCPSRDELVLVDDPDLGNRRGPNIESLDHRDMDA